MNNKQLSPPRFPIATIMNRRIHGNFTAFKSFEQERFYSSCVDKARPVHPVYSVNFSKPNVNKYFKLKKKLKSISSNPKKSVSKHFFVILNEESNEMKPYDPKFEQGNVIVTLNSDIVNTLLDEKEFTPNDTFELVLIFIKYLKEIWRNHQTINKISTIKNDIFITTLPHDQRDPYIFYLNMLVDICSIIQLFNCYENRLDSLFQSIKKIIDVNTIKEETRRDFNDPNYMVPMFHTTNLINIRCSNIVIDHMCKFNLINNTIEDLFEININDFVVIDFEISCLNIINEFEHPYIINEDEPSSTP
jgi:hypothetical protein